MFQPLSRRRPFIGRIPAPGVMTVNIADSLSGIEKGLLSIFAPVADYIVGNEAGYLSMAVPVADSGAGLDALTAAAYFVLTEVLRGREVMEVFVDIPMGDGLTGEDATSIGIAVTASDSAAGAMAVQVAVINPVGLSDGGTVAAALSRAVKLVLDETALGAEIASIGADAWITDSATGDEGVMLNTPVSVDVADSTGGYDGLSAAALLVLAEVLRGRETEEASVEAAVSSGDSAEGMVAVQVAVVNPVGLVDSGAIAEALSKAVEVTLIETGLGTELAALGADVWITETSEGGEAVLINVPKAVLDSVAGMEAVTKALATLLGALGENLSIRFMSVQRGMESKTARRDAASRPKKREVKQ